MTSKGIEGLEDDLHLVGPTLFYGSWDAEAIHLPFSRCSRSRRRRARRLSAQLFRLLGLLETIFP